MTEKMVAVEIDIEELRTKFRELRKARKLSQKEAGDLVGLSQAFVSAFEKGTYSKNRADSLNQVWKLVQFWKQDSSKIVEGAFPSHGVINVPARREQIHGPRTTCPNCGKVIPEEDASPHYCSGCGDPLGLECMCGHVTTDLEANFCSRCARDLRPDAESIRPYPKLKDPDETSRIKYLRAFLKATGEDVKDISVFDDDHESERGHHTDALS